MSHISVFFKAEEIRSHIVHFRVLTPKFNRVHHFMTYFSYKSVTMDIPLAFSLSFKDAAVDLKSFLLLPSCEPLQGKAKFEINCQPSVFRRPLEKG